MPSGHGHILTTLVDSERKRENIVDVALLESVFPDKLILVKGLFLLLSMASDIRFNMFMQQYECLVEGCELKFKSYKNRHQHLLDKHKFPNLFEFFKKSHPSQKQRQKIHRRQVKENREASTVMEVEDDETIDGLVSAVSRLSTSDSTPSSVSFGRRHSRGLAFVPRTVQHQKRPDSSSARM